MVHVGSQVRVRDCFREDLQQRTFPELVGYPSVWAAFPAPPGSSLLLWAPAQPPPASTVGRARLKTPRDHQRARHVVPTPTRCPGAQMRDRVSARPASMVTARAVRRVKQASTRTLTRQRFSQRKRTPPRRRDRTHQYGVVPYRCLTLGMHGALGLNPPAPNG